VLVECLADSLMAFRAREAEHDQRVDGFLVDTLHGGVRGCGWAGVRFISWRAGGQGWRLGWVAARSGGSDRCGSLGFLRSSPGCLRR